MSKSKFVRQSEIARSVFWPLIVLFLSSGNVSASESKLTLVHDNVRWSRLVYEASAFFVTLETEIKLNAIASSAAAQELVLNNEPNVVSPKASNNFKIENYSEGFGKKTQYTLWFGSNGEALQRKKLVWGKKNEIKFYRFTDCGYYTLRKKFNDKKFDHDYSQWQESDKTFSGFEQALCDSGPIYDVNALLYIVSALNVNNTGYTRELLTFSDGKILKVKLTAKKKTSIYGDYKIKSPAREIVVDDTIEVLEVHLEPVTDIKEDRESFRFLGLKGNVKVYVDTGHQLIVRLRGKVDVVGTLDINLKKAELFR